MQEAQARLTSRGLMVMERAHEPIEFLCNMALNRDRPDYRFHTVALLRLEDKSMLKTLETVYHRWFAWKRIQMIGVVCKWPPTPMHDLSNKEVSCMKPKQQHQSAQKMQSNATFFSLLFLLNMRDSLVDTTSYIIWIGGVSREISSAYIAPRLRVKLHIELYAIYHHAPFLGNRCSKGQSSVSICLTLWPLKRSSQCHCLWPRLLANTVELISLPDHCETRCELRAYWLGKWHSTYDLV